MAYSADSSGKYMADMILTHTFHFTCLDLLMASLTTSSGISVTLAIGESTSDTTHFIKILPFHFEPISAL